MIGNPYLESLSWVLIHSIWQFAVLGLIIGAFTSGSRRLTSQVRYLVLVSSLGMVALAPLVTWRLVSPVMTIVNSQESIPINGFLIEPTSESEAFESGASVMAGHSGPEVSHDGDSRSADRAQPAEFRLNEDNPEPAPSATVVGGWMTGAIRAVRPWTAWIVVGWSLGVTVCALRPLLGWRQLYLLRTRGVFPVPEDLLRMLQAVSSQLGLKRRICLLQSVHCPAPMVFGFLQPVILLPVSIVTGMPPAQLTLILAHELSHVRRYDFVVNLFQMLMETLFFYHPVIWWLSRQIRIEREHCCDDMVLSVYQNGAEYGRALLAVAELHSIPMALAMGADQGLLLSRIRRIAGTKPDIDASSPWWLICVVLGLLGSIAAAVGAGQQSALKDRESVRGVVVPIPEGEIELCGLSTGDVDSPWWTAEGLPLKTAPLPGLAKAGVSGEPGRARAFAFRLHGADMDRCLIRVEGANNWSATGRGDRKLYESLLVTEPLSPQKTLTVRIGVGQGAWGPFQKIDSKGAKVPMEFPDRLTPYYENVRPRRLVDDSQGVRVFLPWDMASTRYREEWRAIDSTGKTIEPQWSVEQSERVLRFPLTLAQIERIEFRLQPCLRWVTISNIAAQPGSRTKTMTKVTEDDVPPRGQSDSSTAPSETRHAAESLADLFTASLRRQSLPFLNDKSIESLREEFLDVLHQRPSASWDADQVRRLKEEYDQARQEIDQSQDVLKKARYYSVGLKLPDLTSASWAAMEEGVRQFVAREFNPLERDSVYLGFRNRFETLKLSIAVFRATRELSPEQVQRLQGQRAWMRQQIHQLPESAKFRLTRAGELNKLQQLFDDPLNPFFNWPMDPTEFAKFKDLYAAAMSRDRSELRIQWATTQLGAALVQLRAGSLRDAVPLGTAGWTRTGTRWWVETKSSSGNSSLHLHDRRERPGSSYVDVASMTFVSEAAPAKLEDHPAWLQRLGRGDLAYDESSDAFVAVRGARLAVLKATTWFAADLAPMSDLRRLIEQEGAASVPMSVFVNPSTAGDNQIRDLRENAPSLVVQTQEGRLAVIRLITFGPVIQSHLRPLPPDPPLAPGDIVPSTVRLINDDGTPATFNNIATARVGFSKTPFRPWVGWRDKSGLVSLESLPAGKHWIVAAGEFPSRSIFVLGYPAKEKLIEWKLRASELWKVKDLEFEPRFVGGEKASGEIVVAVKNRLDQPLRITEADFSLHVGENVMYRVLAPGWAERKFSMIEIPAGESREFPLRWSDWVLKGFWQSRESEEISEPALPPDEPDRIYVRVNLGNSGAVPIAVPAPSLILDEAEAGSPGQ